MTATRAPRRGTTVLSLTVSLVVLWGLPARAHPAFRPAGATAGEPTQLELVMEHDCAPRDGQPDPTTLVAIQVPEKLATAEALPSDGWTVSAEIDETGRTAVIEWTIEQDAQPATPPTLPLRVTPDSTTEPTRLELVVLQECSAGSYLWGGGDDDEPPVGLTVAPGTYTAPAPSPALPSPSITEQDPGTSPPTSTTAPSADVAADAADEEQDRSVAVWPLLGLVFLAAGVVAGVTLRRRPGGHP